MVEGGRRPIVNKPQNQTKCGIERDICMGGRVCLSDYCQTGEGEFQKNGEKSMMSRAQLQLYNGNNDDDEQQTPTTMTTTMTTTTTNPWVTGSQSLGEERGERSGAERGERAPVSPLSRLA